MRVNPRSLRELTPKNFGVGVNPALEE